MEEADVGRSVRAHILRPKADEEENCYKPQDADALLLARVVLSAFDDEKQKYGYVSNSGKHQKQTGLA